MASPRPRGTRPTGFHPRRGEIYLVALDPTVGREIQKTRPALVIQNDISNEYPGTTIVAPITSTIRLPLSPVHVLISQGKPSGLDVPSNGALRSDPDGRREGGSLFFSRP
jgi:mRNA-degrading endonuclease toxin of MazEF toxin-antitoxin module